MTMVKLIAYGVILTPVAEIAAFLVVASMVGFAATLLLLVLISLSGLFVLRSAVFARGDRRRAGGVDWGAATGGILLLLPGFVTGLGGTLMLHPKTRKWLLSGIARFGRRSQGTTPPSPVIELFPGEWRQLDPIERLGNGAGAPECRQDGKRAG
jgi:UPF0716 family protein affecting phage T7 exclusion